MSTVGLVTAIVIGTLTTVVVLAVFVSSLFGGDLVAFDSLKTTAPRIYRNLRTICRVNCPLIVLMCIVMIVATPFVAFARDGGLLLAIGGFIFSAIFLWLSIRWFVWSLRA